MPGIKHFKNMAAYRKWLAYGNIHHVLLHKHNKVIIAGRVHKVKHRR